MIFKIIIKKDYIYIWKKIYFEGDKDVGICKEISAFCSEYNLYFWF